MQSRVLLGQGRTGPASLYKVCRLESTASSLPHQPPAADPLSWKPDTRVFLCWLGHGSALGPARPRGRLPLLACAPCERQGDSPPCSDVQGSTQPTPRTILTGDADWASPCLWPYRLGPVSAGWKTQNQMCRSHHIWNASAPCGCCLLQPLPSMTGLFGGRCKLRGPAPPLAAGRAPEDRAPGMWGDEGLKLRGWCLRPKLQRLGLRQRVSASAWGAAGSHAGLAPAGVEAGFARGTQRLHTGINSCGCFIFAATALWSKNE